MRRQKIMIVDDEGGFLEETKELLSLSGYDTEEFSNGISALQRAREAKPDVILLDLKMSPKSGFQVADELTNLPETKEIPIIAMTAFYTEKEHALLMKYCGIKKCLMKPLKPLDLISEIEEQLKEQSRNRMKGVLEEGQE